MGKDLPKKDQYVTLITRLVWRLGSFGFEDVKELARSSRLRFVGLGGQIRGLNGPS